MKNVFDTSTNTSTELYQATEIVFARIGNALVPFHHEEADARFVEIVDSASTFDKQTGITTTNLALKNGDNLVQNGTTTAKVEPEPEPAPEVPAPTPEPAPLAPEPPAQPEQT